MVVNPKVFTAQAFTVEAVVEAGVPHETALLAIADGPRAVPTRARMTLTGRAWTEPTRRYVWGSDLVFLLSPKK